MLLLSRKKTKKTKLYKNILPVCCVCNKIRDDASGEHGEGK